MLKIFKSSAKTAPKSLTIDPSKVPAHVAIIMDGNGRWAKRHGMPRSMGHRKGADVLRDIVAAADAYGVRALTVYGFSTENWKRPPQEVAFLMGLIKEYLNTHIEAMHAKGVRIRFIGYIGGLDGELQDIIRAAENKTANNQGITLHLAINYGGRNEITRAVQSLASQVALGTLSPESITEEMITAQLDTEPYSEVDLLIRPSSDYRISNFLLWQLAYAEFWFTDKHWPEFTPAVLEEAIWAYQQRERRFGGLKDEEA